MQPKHGTKAAGPEPFKHPNEMMWTLDTLSYPGNIQVLMNNILVFSPDDVWLCGWGDAAHGLIWHYDGSTWEEIDICGDIGGMRVDDISGYSSDDIWAVGYSGTRTLIAHYDGIKWERKEPVLEGELNDISSNLNDTLWACGETGLILKLKDGVWLVDSIDIPRPQESQFLLKSIEELNSTVHIIASLFTPTTDDYYYIRGNFGNWKIIDSTISTNPNSHPKWGNKHLYLSPDEKLLSVGRGGTWIFNNGDWKNILDIHYSMNGICRLAEDYFITVGGYGKVFFNNGSDWTLVGTLLTAPYYYYTSVWTNGYEMFVIGHTLEGWPMNTVVWHGE